MKHKGPEKNATASAIKTIQEAEFAVLSSITVREEYKTKLRSLLSIIASQTCPDISSPARSCESAKSSKPKENKIKSMRLQAPEVAEGKDIYVLGDLLLLTRAASVDVVENIQAWREVVHNGMPQTYIYDNINYLLGMCEDLNFLDQVGDLVEWLGFRLVRNPFIVDKALDDIISSRLAISVHNDRSLKYWSSASWLQNNKLISKHENSPKPSIVEPNSASKARWKKYAPPQRLIKPLASISSEDDVVGGSRIAAAQEVLLDEESFHGRLLALKAAQEYVDRGPSTFERRYIDNNAESPAVYDAIAALNSQIKTAEYRSSLLRRERVQVERTLQDLRNQLNWTTLRRDCDHTKNHRVWHCRDIYRQEILKVYAKLVEKIEHCLAVLKGEECNFGDTSDKCKGRMNELRVEKEKQRVARHNKKKEEEAAMRDGIRKKTQGHSFKLRPKKKNLQKRCQAVPEPVAESLDDTNNITYEGVEAEIESDIRVIVKKKSSISATNRESPETIDRQLEEKRRRSIYLKRARLEQQIRITKENEQILDRRRAENVAMKWEDALSRAVKREANRRTRLRAQKETLDRVASCAMFKCMHEMNGKRFLISVYTRNARGYDLEGLRIVAYDPSSSATFTMAITLREFNSLGYGRSSDGLGSFCKWLCLLYEKRCRQFRLVWSGTPCPPPLRVRENDEALVCVHKEGIRMRSTSTDRYCLVSVYLRTDNPSSVRFVLGSWHAQDFLLTEHAVEAPRLVIGSDLDFQWGSSGHATIVWKHHVNNFKSEERPHLLHDNVEAKIFNKIGQRIYSGEVVVNRVRFLVHLYDTSDAEYTLELTPKPKKGEPIQEVKHPAANKLVLLKRKVNPYDVHLSSSNFADLMSLVRFEKAPAQSSNGNAICFKKATISPKWAGKLANYVRVLRLAKYACKIGGVFCFVAVYIVQQKSEFRAHLLLEITWLAPTLSSSFSLGGVPTRQSIRIALSDYLRCVNGSRRFALTLKYGTNESDDEEECSSCVAYMEARKKQYENDTCIIPDKPFECSTNCSNCATIQQRRLHAIEELIVHSGVITPESLELIYHGYCHTCSALAPPIILVLGSVLFSKMLLLPFLEHYFASFDCSKNGFSQFKGDQDHLISEEGLHLRETFLQILERDQVVVLFNADCGVTVASGNAFVHDLHWWLYPDHHDLPCHVAYVVSDHNAIEVSEARDHRDYDLLEAMRTLNLAACQIAELDSVRLDNGDEEESDHASAFDAYLVSEAVLIEATRVLLHPDYEWQKPRKIIGASSWSSACSFLLGPVELSTALQQCDILQLSVATADILDKYFTHEKWPQNYPNVRPFFYGLLNFMMNVQHVHQILVLRSGSLQRSLIRRAVNEGETATEHEQLAKNTTVIDCSQLENIATSSYRYKLQ